MRAFAVLVVGMFAVLAGCADPVPTPTPATETVEPAPCAPSLPAPDAAWRPEMPRVLLNTTRGDILVELDLERAPLTAGNFIDLVKAGTYDGTLFHRVVRGFVIQGGDPLSKNDNPADDGTGDAGYEIKDEFNPELRHTAAGILSMANSGPDTGGSQFFITLAATPHLDDRHAVFGRVVEGMDIVRVLGSAQVDSEDRPIEPVTLTRAELVEPETYAAQHGVGVHVVVPTKKAEPGRAVTFAVIVQNTGNVRDAIGIASEPPAGWTCTADVAPVVPASTGRVVFVRLTPPAGALGPVSIDLRAVGASGESATATVTVAVGSLGKAVVQGDKVTANYAGLLPDGRLFDTSMEAVARSPDQPKFNTSGGFNPRGAYSTFPFAVGSGVIPGFTNLAKTAKVGETVTAFIPAADAYATGNVYERPLTGRDLIFELEIVRVG